MNDILQKMKGKLNNEKVLKFLSCFGAVMAVVLATGAVLINRSVVWALNTWSNLSMEEIVFHLKAPLEGTNSSMIESYVGACVVLAVLMAIALSVVLFRQRKNIKKYYIIIGVSIVGSLLLGGLSIAYIWNELDISAYQENNSTYSSFIDDNYVDPQTVQLTFPEEKRNLIYIVLESMENTFADTENGGAFSENVIPELTELSKMNENFSGSEDILNGGYSLTGSTWTMAALFSQNTGLPLLIPIDRNGMNTQTEFMPGVTSLGDILDNEGYRQIFLAGSDAAFGGRKLFFEEHGNYEISDYYASIDNGEIPEDYHVWWGYEDNILFENAKKRLQDLSSSSEPFNLTMLTVDTHFEDGYVCNDCPDEYGDQYSNVYRCSSQKVTEFVSWIQQQDFYENTTIVISGDHPTMDSDYCENVPDDYSRKVYTTYINAPVQPVTDEYREYSTFDDFPTVLASLGVQISGDRLGLGTNLYSGLETLTEQYGVEKENQEISKKSEVMDSLTQSIEAIVGTVESQGYNEMDGTITVTLRNLEWKYGISGARAAVWYQDQDQNMRWYTATQTSENSYSVTFPVSDFQNSQGQYNIHFYAVAEEDSTPMFIGSANQVVGEMPGGTTMNVPNTISASVEVFPYDYRVGTFSVVINNVTSNVDVQAIRCAVWSEDDQSDLKWYEAAAQGDGSYILYVKARDFAYKESSYYIHTYAIDANGNQNFIGQTMGEIS